MRSINPVTTQPSGSAVKLRGPPWVMSPAVQAGRSCSADPGEDPPAEAVVAADVPSMVSDKTYSPSRDYCLPSHERALWKPTTPNLYHLIAIKSI